jgi:glycosyltransferase involved in cell wall biosynthesis
MTGAFYLCYQSIEEPLIQTQVVSYLEGLARAGYRMVLLTFEPQALAGDRAAGWRQRLAAKGIAWHWLRYHKWPSLPATAWDVAAGVAFGLWLAKSHRVRLVHARSLVPGLMALCLKYLTRAKLLLDLRGFMAEEYVDGGVWAENGLLFRLTKRVERLLVGAADGIIVLTRRARDALHDWYPAQVQGKPIQVIPCCVDLRLANGQRLTSRAGLSDAPKTLVYLGKTGGRYFTREMVDFVAQAANLLPDLRWQVWTQSDVSALRQLVEARGLTDRVSIGRLAPEAVARELSDAAAGLFFLKPYTSIGASPSKVGEYLAAGLPVISSPGVGDLDALLTVGGIGDWGPVGVLVQQFTDEGYRDTLSRLLALWSDPLLRVRCQTVAAECFDLERVGWPRYRQMYERLLGISEADSRAPNSILPKRGSIPAEPQPSPTCSSPA